MAPFLVVFVNKKKRFTLRVLFPYITKHNLWVTETGLFKQFSLVAFQSLQQAKLHGLALRRQCGLDHLSAVSAAAAAAADVLSILGDI